MSRSGAEAMTGVDKAAALMLLMGPHTSAAVLQSMDYDEIAAVTNAMGRIREIPRPVRDQVLREFHDVVKSAQDTVFTGPEYVQQMLQRAVGDAKASKLVNAVFRSASFEFLNVAPMKSLAAVIGNEHPQTIAIVLSQLSSEQAAQLLPLLPDEARVEAILRSASLREVSAAAMEQVGKVLEAAMRDARTKDAGTAARLAEILSVASRKAGDRILEQLKASAPDLAEEIVKRMFLFEQIVELGDATVQKILRKVDQRTLAAALKGAPQNVCEKVYKNMTEEASGTLVEDIEDLGALPIETVEEAQQKVIKVVKSLAAAGEAPELEKK